MRTFSYEILDNQGRISVGQLKAGDLNRAITHLKDMGYFIIDIREKRTTIASLSFFKKEKKVTLGEISLFSRQLASMLQAGIPLTQCLFALEDQTVNLRFKKVVEAVAINVEAGMSFGEALEEQSKIFPSLFTGMVKAGELGGTLDTSLVHLSEQLQKDKTLRDNIRSATFYPSMIGGFAFLMIIAMLVFIVPVFVKMFPPGTELPLPTKMVLAASNSLRGSWYFWILIAGGLFGGIKYLSASVAGTLWLDKLKFRLPVFGSLLQKASTARFTRTLATLLNGGIPILQALDVSGKATGNQLIVNALAAAKEKIEEGAGLTEPLKESNLFPPMVVQMVAVGEQSGTLSEMLNKVSEFFEEEVTIITKGLSAMLEPMLMVGIGLVVGLMVISLYLPIFNAVVQSGI